MRKLVMNNLEKVLNLIAIIAVVYSVVNALIVAKDQMLIAEEGVLGILTFFLSFVFTLGLNLAVAAAVIIVLYMLNDIRILLVQLNSN